MIHWQLLFSILLLVIILHCFQEVFFIFRYCQLYEPLFLLIFYLNIINIVFVLIIFYVV